MGIQSFFKRIFTVMRLRYFPPEELKIIIGAGPTRQRGWISTNADVLDVTNQQDWESLFRPGTIANLFAEHVFEHIDPPDLRKALNLSYTFLRRGGKLRIAVPDKYHPSRYVQDLVKPGGLEPGADDHRFFWSYDVLSSELEQCGFRVEAVEFFDEHGMFHSEPWDESDGKVMRSFRYYVGRFHEDPAEHDKLIATIPEPLRSQFTERAITYTSLFVDAIKP